MSQQHYQSTMPSENQVNMNDVQREKTRLWPNVIFELQKKDHFKIMRSHTVESQLSQHHEAFKRLSASKFFISHAMNEKNSSGNQSQSGKIQQPTSQTNILQSIIRRQSGTSTNQGGNRNPNPEQTIAMVEPIKQDYEQNMFHLEFLQDALQLEAVLFQLTNLQFPRTPVTSSAPIIQYYLYCLLLLNKQTETVDDLITSTFQIPEINQVFETIRNNKLSNYRGLWAFLEKQQISHLEGEKRREYTLQIAFKIFFNNLDKLQKITLKEEILINDFMKYSNAYHRNQNVILHQLDQDELGKNNLCIGFIRFLFQADLPTGYFQVRLPLGYYNLQKLVTAADFPNPVFGEYFRNSTNHSEKLILEWIVANKDQLAKELNQQLEFKDLGNKKLSKVFLELTSEKNICGSCVDMLCKFKHNYMSNDIIDKVNENRNTKIEISDKLEIIIASQFLYNSESDKALILYNHSLINQRNCYYFTFKEVGMLSSSFLKYRYQNTSKLYSLFNFDINQIPITNSIFLSSYIDTSAQGSQNSSSSSSRQNLSQKLLQQQIQQQQVSNQQQLQQTQNQRIIMADISQVLMDKLTQIDQIPYVNYQKDDQFEGDKIQQCFLLLKLMLDPDLLVQFPYELDINGIRSFLKYWIMQGESKAEFAWGNHFSNLNTLKGLSFQIFKQDLISEIKTKIISYQSQVGNSYQDKINIELLLRDFRYLCNQSMMEQQLSTEEIKTNLRYSYKHNYGLCSITMIDKNDKQHEIECLQFKGEKSIFLSEIAKGQMENQLNQFLTAKKVISDSICYNICTIVQLSNQYKEKLERQFQQGNLFATVNFNYMFIRRLKKQKQSNSEQQFTFYDSNVFATRYSTANKSSQRSLLDIKDKISLEYLFYFDEVEEVTQIQIQQQEKQNQQSSQE